MAGARPGRSGAFHRPQQGEELTADVHAFSDERPDAAASHPKTREAGRMAATGHPTKRKGDGMSFHEIIAVIRKRWVAELVVFAVVLAAVAGYIATRQPSYSSSSRVFISFSADGASGDTDADGTPATYEPSDYVEQHLDLIPELVTTPAVLGGVADRLGVSEASLDGKLSAYVSSGYFVVVTAHADSPAGAADLADAAVASLGEQLASAGENGSSIYVPDHLRLTVVDEAKEPSGAESPNVKALTCVGLLGAFAAAFFAALALELSDMKIRDADEIQQLLHCSVLGSLPKSSKYSSQCPVIVRRPDSMEAESVRRVASNLTFMTPDRESLSNVFVISSYGSGEGKTTMSIELAAAFAEHGDRVLFIGADLRHPSVARRLGLDEHVGLSHLLTGQAGAAEAVKVYWRPTLHVLPAGRRVANPGIIVNSNAMKALIEKASGEYDRVVIDAEPLAVGNDAVMFAKRGARLIIMAGQDQVTKPHLRDLSREFAAVGVTPVGVVRNFMDIGHPERKYYGRYYIGTDDMPDGDAGDDRAKDD
ncbi:polysaccharide biosynthesis tyrosine autokinase [Bifidobacterium samirii]|uniref:Lipopolysaccharide biosynthesis protein n=1 Tax=Bifidobacterium samirii TaxID=2306974 RepID=A0A430FU51_9BIFI|nr:polysaccharide biosynthesis tyrosine autokinase [Bifidobacterium samirii]RSX56683.1 lipopolysaccharide biosynthesis protein [Bifidobacterium samirii]